MPSTLLADISAVFQSPPSQVGDMPQADGLFTESLCAALTQSTPEAQEGLAAFLEKRSPYFGRK